MHVAVVQLRAYLQRQWRRTDPAVLSVFGLPRRTNNDAESFFSVFGADFAAAHPSFWVFIRQMNVVSISRSVAIWNMIGLQLGF